MAYIVSSIIRKAFSMKKICGSFQIKFHRLVVTKTPVKIRYDLTNVSPYKKNQPTSVHLPHFLP